MTEGSDGYNFNPDLMLNMPLSDTAAFRINAGMIDNDGIVDYPNVYRTMPTATRSSTATC